MMVTSSLVGWVQSTTLDDLVKNQGSGEMITTKNLYVQELWVARLRLFNASLDVRGHKQDTWCFFAVMLQYARL
jgi:hypothetical protein